MTLGLAGTKPSRKRLRAGESAVGSTGLRLGQGIVGERGGFGFRVANEPLVEKRNGIDAASDPPVFNSLTDFNEGKLSLPCDLGESDALGSAFLRAKRKSVAQTKAIERSRLVVWCGFSGFSVHRWRASSRWSSVL